MNKRGWGILKYLWGKPAYVNTPTEKERAVAHEAAHAVAFVVLGISLRYVLIKQIVIDGKPYVGGKTQSILPKKQTKDEETEFKKRAAIAIAAGPVVELNRFDEVGIESLNDYDKILRLFPNGDKVENIFRITNDLLKDPDIICALDLVREHLSDQIYINGIEAQRMIDSAVSPARKQEIQDHISASFG